MHPSQYLARSHAGASPHSPLSSRVYEKIIEGSPLIIIEVVYKGMYKKYIPIIKW